MLYICVYAAIVVAFYMAIRRVCLHNAYMVQIGVEGAIQEG